MRHLLHHIKKELYAHSFDYLMLITAGVFFLIALSIFKGERLIEFLLLLFFTSFYVMWGIYHHAIQNTIHLKTVIEYILIGFTIIFLIKIFLIS